MKRSKSFTYFSMPPKAVQEGKKLSDIYIKERRASLASQFERDGEKTFQELKQNQEKNVKCCEVKEGSRLSSAEIKQDNSHSESVQQQLKHRAQPA